MTDAILAFVQRQFRASIGTRTLAVDTPIFTSGIVDSFGVLELIAFLEDTFGVTIDTAAHDITEFDSVQAIAALVARLPRRG